MEELNKLALPAAAFVMAILVYFLIHWIASIAHSDKPTRTLIAYLETVVLLSLVAAFLLEHVVSIQDLLRPQAEGAVSYSEAGISPVMLVASLVVSVLLITLGHKIDPSP